MKEIFHPIQNENLFALTSIFEKKIFYSETNLFYEQHIPNVAYLLLDGIVILGRKNKVLKSIEGSGLIGIKNLYQKIPVKFFASIKPNSTVLIIDRSTLFKVVNNKTFLNNYLFN